MLSKFEHCLDFHNVLCPFLEILARALLSKHLLVFKTSWRHVLKTTSTRLQRNNFSSSKTSSKRLEDVLEDEKLLSWRHFKVVFKTCLEDVLDINKIFTGISVSNHGLLTNINQYLTNLYLTNLYFSNLRRIQNALIRTQ